MMPLIKRRCRWSANLFMRWPPWSCGALGWEARASRHSSPTWSACPTPSAEQRWVAPGETTLATSAQAALRQSPHIGRAQGRGRLQGPPRDVLRVGWVTCRLAGYVRIRLDEPSDAAPWRHVAVHLPVPRFR